jgi:hypothetical protein
LNATNRPNITRKTNFVTLFVTIRRRLPVILCLKSHSGDDIMTDGTNFVTQRRKSIGDVAVDGLLAGMGAGVVMGIFLVIIGWITGTGPAEMLGRFDPANNGAPVIGGLLHLAVSGIYGAVFAIALRFLAGRWPALDRAILPVGAAYGMILWLVAHLVLLPGMSSHLSLIAPLQFAIAHLFFGLVLGYLLGRHRSA